MKKFYWKSFKNQMGEKNFKKFIVILFLMAIALGVCIWKYGITPSILLVMETILIDQIKDFIKVSKKANEEYVIDDKKKYISEEPKE